MNSFFSQIKELTTKRQMSMNELERILGFPRNALSNYKNGAKPSAERVLKLSQFFGVPMEDLLNESNNYSHKKEFFERLSDEEKQEMYQICQEWASHHIIEINKMRKVLD